jgi:hypothetical protein
VQLSSLISNKGLFNTCLKANFPYNALLKVVSFDGTSFWIQATLIVKLAKGYGVHNSEIVSLHMRYRRRFWSFNSGVIFKGCESAIIWALSQFSGSSFKRNVVGKASYYLLEPAVNTVLCRLCYKQTYLILIG